MKHTHMIIWVMLLTFSVGLLAGCGGYQNPTMPQLTETAPTATTELPLVPDSTETQNTQPDPLPAPTEPEPALLELSGEERCALNRFLTSFSEQWFHEGSVWDGSASSGVFLAEQADVLQITEFSWLHAKINLDDDLKVVQLEEDFYYGFDLDALSAIAEDFFGRTLTAEELPTAQSDPFFLYEGMVCGPFFLYEGMVCGPAADGEIYTNMTVCDPVYDLVDGTIRADFAIYDTWALIEIGADNFEQEVCCLTGQQAQEREGLELYLYA